MTKSEIQDYQTVFLVGPPNSGKTSLFNSLTGKSFKTVNYPGATVEYYESTFHEKFDIDAIVIDSPGIISLSPSSIDEKIAIEALFNHPIHGLPDLLIVTIDVNQLSRHLYLAKQLIEAGFNIVIAATMTDVLRKNGCNINLNRLSQSLRTDVVEIDPRTGEGVKELVELIKTKTTNLITIPQINVIEKYKNDQYLIETYKQIEEIENNTIFETDDIKNKENVESANNELQILNTSVFIRRKRKIDSLTLKLDKFFLHPYWGLLIFFLIMALTFTSIFWFAVPIMDFVDLVFSLSSDYARTLIDNVWLSSLISDGIISGLGAVFIFVPQIMILFLILGLLEDTGYLARGAMLVDRPLSAIGLNGRSFVPLLSGYACAIPAILSTRTIPNKRERFLTIFIIPLMSCSARLPVYALLIAFLLPKDDLWIGGIILAAIYIFSLFSSVVAAIIANRFNKKIIKEEDNSSFILELPSYRIPQFAVAIKQTFNNVLVYIKQAGPIIVVFSIIIWALTFFPDYDPVIENSDILTEEQIQILKSTERFENSFASEMGKFIQPIMLPLGLDWKAGVSILTAFAAREVFVSSMALIYKVTDDEDEAIRKSLINSMRKAKIEGSNQSVFTMASTIGLIIFFVFALQCFTTVAIVKKETGSWRLPFYQLIVYSVAAYILAFITVNGLRFLGIP